MSTQSQKEFFDKNGYLKISGLLSPKESAHFRGEIQKQLGWDDADFKQAEIEGRGRAQADGVTTNEAFWPLIFNPRLLETVREILGPQARYTQHSDLHAHHGSVGWHRDSANRSFKKGPDWDESREEYRIVRVAIYLQSFAESQFRLGILPGSHRQQSLFTTLELKIQNKITQLAYRQRFLAPFLTAKPLWFPVEPGDCLIFDQRLLHTGTRIRGPKYSVYLSYGADNSHSKNHLRYYYHERKELNYQPPPQALTEHLRSEGLLLEL